MNKINSIIIKIKIDFLSFNTHPFVLRVYLNVIETTYVEKSCAMTEILDFIFNMFFTIQEFKFNHFYP